MAFLGEEMRAHPEAVESRGGFERFSQAALRFFVATVAVVLSAQCVSAQALKITDFETVVKPFTDQHCIDCHGPDRVEGKFRIDKLMEGAHIKSEAEAERWQEVLDLINTGDMPPPEEDEPEKEELVDRRPSPERPCEHQTTGTLL